MSWPNNSAVVSPVKCQRRARRRGQSLIEFALVALVTYMLLAAIVTFGFYFYAAQGSQTTVDFLARELSRSPLPAAKVALIDVFYTDPAGTQSTGATLTPAEQDAVRQFRQRVFDPHYLVLAQSDVLDEANGGLDQSFVGGLPIVNQQLIPLMLSDRIGGTMYFRYPGAIYQDTNAADDPSAPPTTGLLVRIPVVSSRSATGVETVSWVPVVEPILDAGDNDPFPINAAGAQQGLVALRLNYPAQSGAMTGFRANPAGPFEPTIGNPNAADDASVTNSGSQWAPDGPLVASDHEFGAHTGPYGLGKQAAFASPQFIGDATGVRPFRRVISAQAIYRREVFE
jgi:hypothetical protein